MYRPMATSALHTHATKVYPITCHNKLPRVPWCRCGTKEAFQTTHAVVSRLAIWMSVTMRRLVPQGRLDPAAGGDCGTKLKCWTPRAAVRFPKFQRAVRLRQA